MLKFLLFLFAQFALFQIILSAETKKSVKKTVDPNDNKGNTPFFLQDPHDQTCLGPYGFTNCDEKTLWILTRRAGKKTYSLVTLLNPNSEGKCFVKKSGFLGLFPSDSVGLGSCNSASAKSWEFDFIDKTHIKLSNNGKCLVRGKKKYKNSISLQACHKGEFLPLVYHPTAVHEAGFYLKAADGKCFDGDKFRSCEGTGSNRLLWGIGIKYIWGTAKRYIFNFHTQETNNCIVASGSIVTKTSCNSKGALGWALSDGKLTFDDGKYCVARLNDNIAVLARCSEASEYITMDIPSFYTSEDLASLLKNQDKLTPEEKAALAELLKSNKINSAS